MQIEQLKNKIKNLEEKHFHSKIISNRINNRYFLLIYNIFIELSSGIIVAFILNKIYSKIFSYNKLIFALFLLFGSIAGLYNTLKYIKKNF